MLIERSILSLRATTTATQCSAALPTIATITAPMKNSESPMLCEAATIEWTSTSDMIATATPAIASMTTDVRTLQPSVSSPSPSASISSGGLKRSRWVFSEKRRPDDVGRDQED